MNGRISLSDRIFVKIGRCLNSVAGAILRSILRKKYVYQPVPVADLKIQNKNKNEWEVVGPSPQFALKNLSESQPQGWVQMSMWLSFKQAVESKPTLYFDAESGGEKIEKLELVDNKKIKEYVFLPPHIKSLRFLPCDRKCVFTLSSIGICEVSRWEVYLKKFPGFLWGRFRDPGFFDKIKRAFKIWRKLGSLFLIKRILSAVSSNRESQNFAFQDWINRFDTLRDKDKEGIQKHIETLPHKPLVSIITPVGKPPDQFLLKAVQSVRGQLYPHGEHCLYPCGPSDHPTEEDLKRIQGDDGRIKVLFGRERTGIAEAFNQALEKVEGEWVVFLNQDDEIPAQALYR